MTDQADSIDYITYSIYDSYRETNLMAISATHVTLNESDAS